MKKFFVVSIATQAHGNRYNSTPTLNNKFSIDEENAGDGWTESNALWMFAKRTGKLINSKIDTRMSSLYVVLTSTKPPTTLVGSFDKAGILNFLTARNLFESFISKFPNYFSATTVIGELL